MSKIDIENCLNAVHEQYQGVITEKNINLMTFFDGVYDFIKRDRINLVNLINSTFIHVLTQLSLPNGYISHSLFCKKTEESGKIEIIFSTNAATGIIIDKNRKDLIKKSIIIEEHVVVILRSINSVIQQSGGMIDYFPANRINNENIIKITLPIH